MRRLGETAGADTLSRREPPSRNSMSFTISWNIDANGDWADTADWNPARLPGINTLHLHKVTYSTAATTVQSLTVGNDNFAVSGGSLTITGASSFAHALSVSGGTLGLGGTTTVAGLFSGTGGTISGAAR